MMQIKSFKKTWKKRLEDYFYKNIPLINYYITEEHIIVLM